MKDRADMHGRGIAGQIELDRDALPMRVGMRCDQVAWNVSGQHWDRIKADALVVNAKAASECRSKPTHQGILEPLRAKRAANDVPNQPLVWWQMANVLRKEIKL